MFQMWRSEIGVIISDKSCCHLAVGCAEKGDVIRLILNIYHNKILRELGCWEGETWSNLTSPWLMHQSKWYHSSCSISKFEQPVIRGQTGIPFVSSYWEDCAMLLAVELILDNRSLLR